MIECECWYVLLRTCVWTDIEITQKAFIFNIWVSFPQILSSSGHLHDNWRPEAQRAKIQQSIYRRELCITFHLYWRHVFLKTNACCTTVFQQNWYLYGTFYITENIFKLPYIFRGKSRPKTGCYLTRLHSFTLEKELLATPCKTKSDWIEVWENDSTSQSTFS